MALPNEEAEGQRVSALPPGDLTIVVVDVQERLCTTMDADDLASVQHNIGNLIELAHHTDARVLCTEQYPRGLGATVPGLSEKLTRVDAPRFEKTDFSAAGCDAFMETLVSSKPRHLVITGMEAHICVLMTSLDLASAGYTVHVPHDAVISRHPRDRDHALMQLRQAGVQVTSTETVLFRALERSGSDIFRTISRLIR